VSKRKIEKWKIELLWFVGTRTTAGGATNAEILIMPGETQTLKWKPLNVGVVPFYCTDFCSALHQEMSGYARVSAAGSNTPLKFSTGVDGK
jgi:nitrous-oxide reductase